MLQTLLADRFKLKLRPEMKEMPVYNLVVVKDGKIQPSDRATEPHKIDVPSFHSAEISILEFATVLQGVAGRSVIDRTNLSGSFDILLEFRPSIPTQTPGETDGTDPVTPPAPFQVPELQLQLQEQLGLKLESAKAVVEVLVIEHAERPSPN
jgi:uncharacterized protein (TIGR03435 family)